MSEYIMSFMAPWMFNPFTSNFDYYQAGSSTPVGGTFDFIDATEFEFIDTTYFDFIT